MEDKDMSRLKNLQEKKTKLLIILSLVGIIIFLLSSATLPFKDKLFSLLYPKPASKATEEKKEEAAFPKTEFVSNELLVKVKKAARGNIKENPADTGIASLNKIFKEEKAKGFERVAKAGKNSDTGAELFSWYKITLDAPTERAIGKLNEARNRIEQNLEEKDNPAILHTEALFDLQRVIDKLNQDSNIESVELNYIVTTQAVPNDPYYSSTGSWGQAYPDLWGIKKINPEPAWDQTTGSASIIVADIDTGVDRNHEDLQGQMWTNPGETPTDGVDNDGNGYIDDYYGWDFNNNDNDPMDDHGHGTHTVGTIAAVGNNGMGVVGVNWTSKIMALKFLSSSGSGSLDNGIKALQYAADMRAKVSSNSWGCACSSQAMDDAVKYEHDKGMVMVAAAANSNADAIGFSPANADYAITVAASDWQDLKASFSNWGEKIDVAAPGVDILSTRASVNPMCTEARTVGTSYCRVSGTSMATPHVAGLAALLLSKNPSLNNEEIRQILRNGADDLGTAGKDSDFGYGRISALGSLNLSNIHPLTPVITSPKSRSVVFGTAQQITGSISGDNFAHYTVEAGLGRTPSSWVTVADSTIQPFTDSVLATVDTTKLSDGLTIFRVTATDNLGKKYQFQIYDVEVDNFDTQISSPIGSVSKSQISIAGTAQTKNGLTFSNYVLEWGEGSSPTTWSTAGITLNNGGSSPVVNGILGTWDTTALTHNQQYTLRLTVNAPNDVKNQITTEVVVDQDLVPGWPKILEKTTEPILWYSSVKNPAFADLDGDGNKEIIFPTASNKIEVFRKDGSSFPGFPFVVSTAEYFTQTVNVDDLDNDGKKEIIAASVDTSDPVKCLSNGGTIRCPAKVYIVRYNGTSYPGWPNIVFPQLSQDVSDVTPTIADLDRDGIKELIVIDPFSNKIHAYKPNGAQIAGFPKTGPFADNNFRLDAMAGYIIAIPTAADVDSDGDLEIAYGLGDKFYLFDHNANLLWSFTAPPANGIPVIFENVATAGDMDGVAGGDLEIVAAGFPNCNYGIGLVQIYVWKKDGQVIPGWPKEGTRQDYPGCAHHTPSVAAALADVDSDGKDELISIYDRLSLKIFDLEGEKTFNPFNHPLSQYVAALSDINGDGKMEYASNVYRGVHVMGTDRNADGSVTTWWWRNLGSNIVPVYADPGFFADMDNNGKMEYAIVSHTYPSSGGCFNCDPTIAYTAYLWELPYSPAKYEWPMFGYDAQRTGRLVLGPRPSPTLLPTPTATPTLTPSPSSTPSPTPTSSPAPTPTPSPCPSGLIGMLGKLIGLVDCPPTAPTNLTANPVSSSQINLSWTASSDDVGVAGYEIYRNNVKVATSTTTSYGDTGLAPSTTYTYFVKAYDAAGNISSSSNTVSVTTLPVISYGSITGTVYSSAGGTVPGAKITIRIDKTNLTYYTNALGVYSIPNLPPGTYSLTFQAKGYANLRTTATVTAGSTITKNVTMVKR